MRTAQSRFYSALTVVQLKAELKARGVKRTGRKAILVQALADALNVASAGPTEDFPTETSAHKGKEPVSTISASGVPIAVAEEVTHRIPGPFDRSNGAALDNEPIMDAELAMSQSSADGEALDGKEVKEEGSAGEEVTDLSSSRVNEVPDSARKKDVSEGFNRARKLQAVPGTSSPREMPRLPPPTDEMKKKWVIQDLMERRNLRFSLEEALDAEKLASGPIPESDMYAVFSSAAIRPWDGPHAHRAEIHVVVLLSDVMGWEDEYTRSAADQIADVCDAIVLVPDMFRGRPWSTEQPEEGYEEWRASHDPVNFVCHREIIAAIFCHDFRVSFRG